MNTFSHHNERLKNEGHRSHKGRETSIVSEPRECDKEEVLRGKPAFVSPITAGISSQPNNEREV